MADIQTEAQVSQAVAPAVKKVEVNQDGSLSGMVYANVAGQETPVDAKVTLASEGVVIEAVQTENGSFSFANIAPGSYTLTGAAAGFAGGQSLRRCPFRWHRLAHRATWVCKAQAFQFIRAHQCITHLLLLVSSCGTIQLALAAEAAESPAAVADLAAVEASVAADFSVVVDSVADACFVPV